MKKEKEYCWSTNRRRHSRLEAKVWSQEPNPRKIISKLLRWTVCLLLRSCLQFIRSRLMIRLCHLWLDQRLLLISRMVGKDMIGHRALGKVSVFINLNKSNLLKVLILADLIFKIGITQENNRELTLSTNNHMVHLLIIQAKLNLAIKIKYKIISTFR